MSNIWPDLTLWASQEENYKHYLARWLQNDVIRLIAEELECALYPGNTIEEIDKESIVRWVTHVERMVKQLSQYKRNNINDDKNNYTESDSCKCNLLCSKTQKLSASILHYVMCFPASPYTCTLSIESESFKELYEEQDVTQFSKSSESLLSNSTISMLNKTSDSYINEIKESDYHTNVEKLWERELVNKIMKVSSLPLSKYFMEHISFCELVLLCVLMLFHSQPALQEWSLQSLLHMMSSFTESYESNYSSNIDGKQCREENDMNCTFKDALDKLYQAWSFALLFITCTASLMHTSPYLQPCNNNKDSDSSKSKTNISDNYCEGGMNTKTASINSLNAMSSLASGFMNVFFILNKLTDVLTKCTNQLSIKQNSGASSNSNLHSEQEWMQGVEKMVLTHIHPVTPLLLNGEMMLLWMWKDSTDVREDPSFLLEYHNNENEEKNGNLCNVNSSINKSNTCTERVWEEPQETKHLSRWAHTATSVEANTYSSNAQNYSSSVVNRKASLPSVPNTFTYAELVKCITIKDKSFLRKLHTVSKFMHILNTKLKLLTQQHEQQESVKWENATQIKEKQTLHGTSENNNSNSGKLISINESQQTLKAIIKVLIHTLINTAKHHTFNENTTNIPQGLELCQLWCTAALLVAPTDKLPFPVASTPFNNHVSKEQISNNTPLVKNVNVPYNSAGWLLRALLRNAFTQLHVTEAVALAKENKQSKYDINKSHCNSVNEVTEQNTHLESVEGKENKELIRYAIETVYALLSSLSNVLPPFVYTNSYFYSVLIENEQVLVSLAIGAIIKEHSECGVYLLRWLMEVDVCQSVEQKNRSNESNSNKGNYGMEESLHKSRNEQEHKHNTVTLPSSYNSNVNKTNLQRVWTNYPLLLHHFIKSVCKQEENNEFCMEKSSNGDNIHSAKLLIKLMSLLYILFMYSTNIAEWHLLCAPSRQCKNERLQLLSSSSSVFTDQTSLPALQVCLLHFVTAVEETLSKDEERIKHILHSYLQNKKEECEEVEKEEESNLITVTCFLELTNKVHLQRIGAILHRVLFALILESTWESKVQDTALYMWHKLILNQEMFANALANNETSKNNNKIMPSTVNSVLDTKNIHMTLHYPMVDDMARAQCTLWLNILSHCITKLNDVVQMELTRVEIEENDYGEYYEEHYNRSFDADSTSDSDEKEQVEQREHEQNTSIKLHDKQSENSNIYCYSDESDLFNCNLKCKWSMRALLHSVLCVWWTSALMCDVCVFTPEQWTVLVKSVLVHLPSYEVIHKVTECLCKNNECNEESRLNNYDQNNFTRQVMSSNQTDDENNITHANTIMKEEKKQRTHNEYVMERLSSATNTNIHECKERKELFNNMEEFECWEYKLYKVQTHLLHCVLAKHHYVALPSLITVLIHLTNCLNVYTVCKNKDEETKKSKSFTKTITEDLKPIGQRLHMMMKTQTAKASPVPSSSSLEISEFNRKTSISQVLNCKNNVGTQLMHEVNQYSPPWFAQCFQSAYVQVQNALNEQEKRFEQYEWEEYVNQVWEEERKQAKLAEQHIKRQNTKLREVEIAEIRKRNGECVNTISLNINTINKTLEEWGNEKKQQETKLESLQSKQKAKQEEQQKESEPTMKKKKHELVTSNELTSNKTQTIIAIRENKLSVNTPISETFNTNIKSINKASRLHVTNNVHRNCNKEEVNSSYSNSANSSNSNSYVSAENNLQTTSVSNKPIEHISKGNNNIKPSGPSSLQKKVALIQQRQQWEQMHVEHQVECEAAIRRIAARTNVWHSRPIQVHDIIGNSSHSYHNRNQKNSTNSNKNSNVNKSRFSEDYMIEELPMIPEIFISTKQEISNNGDSKNVCEGAINSTSPSSSSSSLTSTQTVTMNNRNRFSAAALAYAHCFAPHIALELRYEIVSKFDDMMDLAVQHYNRKWEQQHHQRERTENKCIPSEKYNKEKIESNNVKYNTEIQHNTSSKRYFDYNSETLCDDHINSSISNALYNSEYKESNNFKRTRNDESVGKSCTPNSFVKRNVERVEDLFASLSRDFPLNSFIARDGIPVINTLCHPADPLDPTRITFSITPHCNINNLSSYQNNNNNYNNIASMSSFTLQSELNEGDVVVVLLPLASLLPMWVEYMQNEYDNTHTNKESVENGVKNKIKELLDSIPHQWRVLGCYLQICVVAGFPPGQRNALLCTYPQYASYEPTTRTESSSSASSTVSEMEASDMSEKEKYKSFDNLKINSYNNKQKGAKYPHIPFLHALQMGFTTVANSPRFVSPPNNINNSSEQELKKGALQRHQVNSSENTFYLIKLTSINASLTAIYAIHQIYHTRFAPTLFDPRSTSHDSEMFHRNITTLFKITDKTSYINNSNTNNNNNVYEKSVISQIRNTILLEEKLNDWQIQAIAAVLYAVKSHWLPLDTLHNTSITKHNSSNDVNNKSANYNRSNNHISLNKEKQGVEFIESNEISKNVEQLFYPSSTLLSSSPSSTNSSSVMPITHTNAKLTPATLFMNARTPEIIIIEGPPGTGKTQTIASLCINLLSHLSNSTGKVLLCAPSNCAVDEALLRTIQLRNELKVPKVHNNVHLSHLYSLQRGNNNSNNCFTITRVGVRESVDNDVLSLQPIVYWDDMVDEIIRSNNNNSNNNNRETTINNGGKKRRRGVERGDNNSYSNSNSGGSDFTMRMRLRTQVLNESRLIFSTLGSLNQIVKCGLHIDVVIIDEASQGTEPDVLQALMLASSKCVLVGDSKQLQPTVLCPHAASHGLKQSLLMRLLHNGHSSFMLRTQYRMHMDIVRFPNMYFYNNRLITPDCVLRRSQLITASYNKTTFDEDNKTQRANEKKTNNGNFQYENNFQNSELEEQHEMKVQMNANRHTLKESSMLRKHEFIAQKLRLHARLAFVNVCQSTMQHGRGHSLVNHKEVDALLQCMRQLRCFLQVDEFTFAEHIGVITFYKAQRDAIMQRLTRREKESKVQVATVDSFQGKEKDIIFISCVRTLSSHEINKLIQKFMLAAEMQNKDRSNSSRKNKKSYSTYIISKVSATKAMGITSIEDESEEEKEKELTSEERHNDGYKTQDTRLGFLSNWHRINVALTRARELCVVFGHAETFMASALTACSHSRNYDKELNDGNRRSKENKEKLQNMEQKGKSSENQTKGLEVPKLEKKVIDVDNGIEDEDDNDNDNVNQSQTKYKATTLDDTQETIERELHKADDDPCVLSELISHTMKYDTFHNVEPEQILNIASHSHKYTESNNDITKKKNEQEIANQGEKRDDENEDDDSSVCISSQPFRDHSVQSNDVVPQARFITWKPSVKLMDELAL